MQTGLAGDDLGHRLPPAAEDASIGVVITGNQLPGVQGVDSFIRKPVKNAAVREAVVKLLEPEPRAARPSYRPPSTKIIRSPVKAGPLA